MYLTSFRAIRAAFTSIVLASAVCAVGCGGGGGSTPAPTPQATAPTINLSTGTYTTAQTLTVTGAAGTIVHCTLDGSTPTASSAPCPSTSLSTNGTTTAKAYATESGYTDSVMVTATITINIPVTPTISWTNSSLTIANPGNATDAGASLVVTSSVLNGAGTCAASAGNVTITVATTGTDSSVVSGSFLASFAADSTHVTYGTLYAGNTFTTDKINTYHVTATCPGLTPVVATLTVTDPPPAITSVTPAIVKATATGTNFVLKGSGFSNYNAPNNLNQWLGTEAGSVLGSCPSASTAAMFAGGIIWTSSTQVGQGSSGGFGLGSWSYYDLNGTTSTGTGGGYNCLANAFQSTATGMVVTGGGALASVNVGRNNLSLTSNGTTTALTLPNSGAREPVSIGNSVYVPNGNVITVVDVGSNQMSSIALPVFPVLDTTDGKSFYFTAVVPAGNGSVGIYRLEADQSLTLLAVAGIVDDLKAINRRVLWVNSAGLNVLDIATGAQHLVSLSTTADSIAVLSDGTVIVYRLNSPTATVVNLAAFTEAGTTSFVKGILGFSTDAFSLVDGSIGTVALNANTEQLVWTQVTTANLNDVLGGFVLTPSSNSNALMVNTTQRGSDGVLAPQALIVPAPAQ